MMHLQAKECWQPAEAGGGTNSLLRRKWLCQYLVSTTGENTFPVFKLPS